MRSTISEPTQSLHQSAWVLASCSTSHVWNDRVAGRPVMVLYGGVSRPQSKQVSENCSMGIESARQAAGLT